MASKPYVKEGMSLSPTDFHDDPVFVTTDSISLSRVFTFARIAIFIKIFHFLDLSFPGLVLKFPALLLHPLN